MHLLKRLWTKETRTVAGLMSGTSLDGVDAVVAQLSGQGATLKIEQIGFISVPYPDDLRAILLRNSSPEHSSVQDLSQLNVRLAHQYAAALQEAVKAAGITLSDLDLVGSHGQTVHHVPDARPCAGLRVTSTLQIGDPSVLANLIHVPVVGDFRIADMTLGGQGAPLVPYFDFVYFADPNEARGVLNIGGIANITVLPPRPTPDTVRAFDTGPGNMVMDALAQRFLRLPYDAEGEQASQGQIQQALLAELLEDPFFAQPPPKSTGRERFGGDFVDRLVVRSKELAAPHHPSPQDWLATAAALTAASIYQAYARFVRNQLSLDVVIVSGGGLHNRFLMDKIRDAFAPIPIRAAASYGLDADAKEALCFAVLAHETVNGVAANLPSVTGASGSTLLGKLCVPL